MIRLLTRLFIAFFVFAMATFGGQSARAEENEIVLHRGVVVIGDNRGYRRDLQDLNVFWGLINGGSFRESNQLPSATDTAKTFSFTTKKNHEVVVIRVGLYSLTPKGEYDCPTTVSLNEREIWDLREPTDPGEYRGEHIGSSDITGASIRLSEKLTAGEHKITIAEKKCANLNAFNDSAILWLVVTFE